MANFIFWASLLILAYTFVGYPLLLNLIAVFFRKVKKIDINFSPKVSIVLAVYNEEQVIKGKIENFLDIDYPFDNIELIIISDCCDDKTEEIIRFYENSRIKLLIQSERAGKTSALNRGVVEANGEIIVFTDANSMFNKNAINKIVRHFSDRQIGLVSGRSIYSDPENKFEEIGGTYRKYEEMIKRKESFIGSIAGADGAIYALRRDLYSFLPPQYINDLIHPIQVVLKGFRAISDPEVLCRETVDDRHTNELDRQTRIMAQSWLILLSHFKSLLFGNQYLYLLVLISHKLLRWLTVLFLLLLLLATVLLLSTGVFYKGAFYAQLFFYSTALAGIRIEKGILKVPYLFLQLHYAAILGLVRLLSGNQFIIWNPRTK